MESLSRGRLLIALGLIVLTGAGLRFAHLTRSGPFLWDEGIFLCEGQYVADIARLVWYKVSGERREAPTSSVATETLLIDDVTKVRGIPSTMGNPLHAGLVGLGLLLFDNRDWSGRAVSALLGTLTIPVVFLLGRILYNPAVGLLASALFAVSGYHLLYSREALAESNAIFFLCVSLYSYIKSHRSTQFPCRWLSVAGLSAGLAFATKFRILFPPPVLALYVFEACAFRVETGWLYRKLKIRLIVLSVAFMIPLLLIELPYHIPYVKQLGEVHHIFPPVTFSDQILPYITYLIPSSPFDTPPENPTPAPADSLDALNKASEIPLTYTWHWDRILTFPYLLWKLDGLMVMIAFLGGVSWLSYRWYRERQFEDFFLLVQTLGGWIFWAYATTLGHARLYSGLLPAVVILAALFLYTLARRAHRTGRPLLWGGISLILIVGTIRSQDILGLSSGYREAYGYLHRIGATRYFSTQLFIPLYYRGYTPNEFILPVSGMPASDEALRAGIDQGLRYLVVDYEPWLMASSSRSPALTMLERIQTKCKPVLVVDNTFGGSLQARFEHQYFSFRDLLSRLESQDAQVNKIAVYDLANYVR